MATRSVASEIIERERKKLLEILQQDPDSVLDTLTSRRLISEEEYETLENITDPLKKIRKLLILVQKKGEVSCQHFLKCLCSTFPESPTIWDLGHEFLKHENIEPPQCIEVRENSQDTFFPEEKQPENCEITESFKEKEHLDLGTFETFVDKKTSYRETAWSPRKNEKECNTPEVTLPHLVENVEYEIPATIDYLQDEQRYEELDDSLYLGEEEYLESVVYSKDAETTEEEEDYYDPEHHVYYGEEDSEYSETTEFSDEEQNYGDSEPGMSLEEEEEEKSMEEKKNLFKDVLSRLNMDRSRKLLPDFVKQFSLDRGCNWTPQTPGDLAWNFLMKVQALDVTARDSVLRHKVLCEDSKGELPTGIENLEMRDIQTINPLDVLCASMLCSDSSLQRRVLSSMYQCQFALPLLLPDAENNKSILMLGAMKDIVKKQSTQSSGGPTRETETFLTLIKVPVISFVRLGNCSFSKSRILNTLLSPTQQKSQKIFLHQDLPVLVLPRQISDGLVEITWCFPDSDSLKENPSFSQKPVAVANLRGDLESFWTQFGFLMEVSSAVFFFTNCLGEKEWNLLMFLGEAAIERCYFVLSPQARENEEAQIFQRILKLKPSQLLFWEEEEAGDKGKNIKGLQAALQEVMSSSLRCVSVEDMASLARELGIQVDQDFENVQGIQVSPGENLAGTVEDEGQQRHSPPQSSPGNPAEKPMKEPVAGCEVSQTLQNIHLSPVFTRHLQNSCLLPVRIGCNFNHVSLKAPWVRGSHFWSEQKTKWFHPSPFQNARVHSRGKGFGIQYFQPRRFYSGERFMNFSRPPQGRHVHGTFVRPPRPLCHRVQAWPEGSRERSARVVSQVGHLHSLSSQPVGPFGKPQSGQAHAWRTQTPEATGKVMRTTSHTVNPHPQAFQPAGVVQKPTRPAFQQGFKQKMERGPSNPVFRMGSHPMSNSKVLPSSQFKSNQPQPSQVQHSQPKPFQPMPSQLKRTQTKATQPQPSQAKCSPSKPTQPKPCQPQSSQSKPSQPRSTQPKSSQTRPSQAKAGPKRVGKH
ncbi:caspase recruitment domain-containing protein 6 [Pteropus alecto]|uniref:Caspase recruitment domain-containing protein 6 n=1 Tax=Pteropus alecto TaxID=9402 RepID=L5K305_PTEAL|nr:caspase recruitment domain-containing protein 6 [Pteropus alecto]ELK06089.1 Caspase recruitment domain-containing protein 6 [Pteropus alecto]